MNFSDPNRITYFGFTDYRNKRERFGIKASDRARHIYVIGKTGMGKSTLLDNMAIQDIQNGEGIAFLDPHGSSAEKLLDYVPEERVNDVLYFAPFDNKFPVAFNILEDVGYDKRHLVVSGLMSVFEKIWVDQWSARMAHILQNTLFALLEYPGATLLAVNRMYVDKSFRKKVVDNVTDPAVKDFWEGEFANYTDRFAADATPAIQNKIGQFVSNPIIRNIIGQPTTGFDFRKIMDEKKIVIVNLSKGQIGESNANLLGSMLVTKMYLAALSRADVTPDVLGKLPHFNLFVDEFQSFANKSFADILSEARKYKLNLHIAHQYVEQMPEEVAAAVIGNVGTMITFRIGGHDAEMFEKEFAPEFTAEDFVNLGQYQLYLKLMVDGVSSSPFSATGIPPIEPPATSYRDVIVASSRKQFATPREKVEQDIINWHEASVVTNTGSNGKEKKPNQNAKQYPPKKKFKQGSRPYKKDTPPKQNNALRDALSNVLKETPSQQSNNKPTPVAPQNKEAELRKAVSLDRFRHKPQPKKPKQKSKGPSKQRISELKEALTMALGDSGRSNKQKKKEVSSQQPKQQNESSKVTTSSETKEKPTSKTETEVPEHVLKKLLDMEKNDKK